MVRPHRFRPNAETAADNAFQQMAVDVEKDVVARQAFDEVSQVAQGLQAHGVRVHLFDDDGSRDTPDAVFPNNWFSTHAGGSVVLYPMKAINRRRERRADVIELLKSGYRVQELLDYSALEHDGRFLEGTGAMVLDHLHRLAYTALSGRADRLLLERVCTRLGYEAVAFETQGPAGQPVYHTNVLMCVATGFALVGFDAFRDAADAARVRQRLHDGGREVIALSPAQIEAFAGNAIELSGREGRVLALSQRAFDSLQPDQRARIERTARLLPFAVPTIERAGGSVRCMIAGIHLRPRT
jgi:hypothetical protein